MLTPQLENIRTELKRDYYHPTENRGFEITSIVRHGDSYVVLFERWYDSTIGTKGEDREHRVATFRFANGTSPAQRTLKKHGDFIA